VHSPARPAQHRAGTGDDPRGHVGPAGRARREPLRIEVAERHVHRGGAPPVIACGREGRGDARVLTGDAGEGREERQDTDAAAARAGVEQRERIAVVAGCRVRRVQAAGARAARVVGVDVPVVAVERRPRHTRPEGAGVPGGAGVAVGAGAGVVRVYAAEHGVAAVGGADVAVVAVDEQIADISGLSRRRGT